MRAKVFDAAKEIKLLLPDDVVKYVTAKKAVGANLVKIAGERASAEDLVKNYKWVKPVMKCFRTRVDVTLKPPLKFVFTR